jgi:hypothetical protein
MKMENMPSGTNGRVLFKDKQLILYFAYGSNLWRKQMRDRCPACEEIGYGVLRGYRWIISQRGFATLPVTGCDAVCEV